MRGGFVGRADRAEVAGGPGEVGELAREALDPLGEGAEDLVERGDDVVLVRDADLEVGEPIVCGHGPHSRSGRASAPRMAAA